MTRSTDKLKVTYSLGGPESQSKCANKIARWEQVRALFAEPMKTKERHSTYLGMEQDQRAKMKLLPGWICAAAYRGNRRKKSQIIHLGMLTFDLDNATPELLDALTDPAKMHDFCEYEYVLHTTRSHTPAKPRFRLVMPIERPVQPDEYQAIVRLLAQIVDPTMQAVDHVTFRPAQLMYNPSCSADQEYVYHENFGRVLEPATFLEAHGGWQDFNALPKGANEKVRHQSADKAEDPTEKDGIVGDFCRAYDVVAAMELIPGTYALGDGHEDGLPRYTYLKGTGANGVVVYDDGKFIYSHHGSDPCGDRLCNAWDMVRLHRFGDLDNAVYDENLAITSHPSYKAICAAAAEDPKVLETMATARLGALDLFEVEDEDEDTDLGDGAGGSAKPIHPEAEPDDHKAILAGGVRRARQKPPKGWRKTLAAKSDGRGYRNIPENFHIIFANEPRLCGRIVWDEMVQRPALRYRVKVTGETLVTVPQPRPGTFMRTLTEIDARLIKTMLEYRVESGGYGFEKVAQADVDQSLAVVAHQNPVNAAREFFEACASEWDGNDRISTMFARHLGEVQDAYTAEAALLFLCGIVARTYEPGHKFDFMPVIQGAQGAGKSTYPGALIGEEWVAVLSHGFEDTNKLIEQSEGKLIMEVGELSALTRSEVERVKEQITTTMDKTRLAYGRMAMEYPRRFVLLGTTNRSAYLTDPTGNRRYWPLKAAPGHMINLEAVAGERRQLFGQAVHEYRRLRKLHHSKLYLPIFLKGDALRLWEIRVAVVTVDDIGSDTLARITAWLDTPIPLSQLDGPNVPNTGEPMVLRTKTSTAQVMRRALGHDLNHPSSAAIFKSVGAMLGGLPGWTRSVKPRKVDALSTKAVYVREGAKEPEISRGWQAVFDGTKPRLYRPGEELDVDDVL